MRAMRCRGALVLVLLLALACANLRAVADGDAAESPRSLRILLTNDDGVDAPGLVELRQALLAGGHRVVVVAPSRNRSGSSISITTGGTVEVRKVEPDVFALEGSPADCVLIGTQRLVEGPVDLVVSGVNMGQNVGRRTVASGTVGATIAAATLGHPAVAFSQTVDPVDYRKTPRFFPGAAAYAATFVAALAEEEGRVIPRGIVLNVNFPARPIETVRGVRLTRQGSSVLYVLKYEPGPEGAYSVEFEPSDVEETVKGADTTALAEGYISVTPLDPSWTVGEEVFSQLEPLAKRLAPPRAAAAGAP
ncbi:MAG: 5'/3'-nucleotidase SurE [Myxococcota bacterium]|nr:5'/3'-nucleotidase SurE [Myxococcota bacterium]